MRRLSRLCLTIGILVWVACIGACAEPTIRPTCGWTTLWIVETWVDWNGNGTRDPEDGALKGVRFRMEWYYYSDGSGERIKTWTSDASGHDEIGAEGCGGRDAKIQAVAPPGYRLTTDDPTSFGFAPP